MIRWRQAVKVNTRQWQLCTKVRGGTVSTALLPITHPGGMNYETCVFFDGGESNVVERYATQVEAAKGHSRHVADLGGRVWLG